MLISYLNLRAAIGIFAILLPPVVYVVGYLSGTMLQPSISAYYHVDQTRDIFVAVLCAIGVFLFCYSGYPSENWVHKLMGLAAVGVAMCPTYTDKYLMTQYEKNIAVAHLVCAVLLMVLMAFTALVLFPKNQNATPMADKTKLQNAWRYRICGIVIVAALGFYGLRLGYYALIQQDLPNDSTLYWVEFIAIWAFGIAWLLKSHLIGSLITRFMPPRSRA